MTISQSPTASSDACVALSAGYLAKLMTRRPFPTTFDLLGGQSVLGKNAPKGAFDPLLWNTYLETGMPIHALDHFQQAFESSQGALLGMLDINARSLQRKRQSPHGLLLRDEATRVINVARLVERALEVLGSADGARNWLSTANPSLDGKTPLSLASRSMGLTAALDALNAIEHGMFA